MLIIEVNDTESIDRVLKNYKRKLDRAGIVKELRERKHYTKPSVKKRINYLKAEYRQRTFGV